MKKYFIGLLTALLLLPSISFSATKLATLSDGVHKAVVEVGSQTAQFYFGKGYTLYKELTLGSFAPSTGFTTKLLASITSSATTIYVSSVKDINGIALPCSATNKCYFNIEPGTSRQEPIVCTTAGTNYFSGCTRGLAASGSSEAAVTAYQLPHNAGSTIIMTNIAQFYGNFVDVTTTQNIGGLKTFTATTTFSGLPNTTTSYTPTADGDLATKKFVGDSISAGGVDATESVKGVSQLSTKAQAALGTSSGSAARLVLPASMATSTSQVATTSIPVTNTSGKLDTSFIDQTANYTWSGTNTFATSTMATTTFSGPVYGIYNLYFGDGSDGASTTVATTTLSRDMYFTDLTVANGTTIITNGFKVYVKNTTTFVGTGRLWANGNAGGNGGNGSGASNGAAGAAGAIAYSVGTLPIPSAGIAGGAGDGAAGTDGASGKSLTNIAGSNGGKGGNGQSCGGGGSNGGAKGAGGAKVARSYINSIFDISFATFLDTYGGTTARMLSTNGSGSGGTGNKDQNSGTSTDAAGGGGGSGSGGGVIYLASNKIITVNGNIYATAAGGNGGNGGNPACTGSPVNQGGSGGGGGGDGGAIILIYSSKTGTGTTNVAGGSKGVHSVGVNCGCDSANDGDDGVDGATGLVLSFSFN